MLTSLELKDFRSYENREFKFEDGVNVVCGHNASGKTNLLEAVSLLATGESFKAQRTEEMIRFGSEIGRVTGRILRDGESDNLEVMVTTGMVGGVRTLKKKYLINGTGKRKKDYQGQFAVSIFRPEDMDMLTGTPDHRRKYLDDILTQTSEEYVRSLSTYQQALRRRNKLLDAVREGLASRYSLTFWDGLLIKHGQQVSLFRQDLIKFINRLWERSELFNKLELEHDKSTISDERLAQYKEEELAVGYTLVGPHKDDLIVRDGGRDMGIYGSRGEQRMAVLALKLGEIYFLEDKRNERPLLLLDDIFSELDEVHKSEVLRVMQNRQVLVTTALERDVDLIGDCNKILL